MTIIELDDKLKIVKTFKQKNKVVRKISVIQLDNGEVHNIYELKDIKDFVDNDVYKFIEEIVGDIEDEREEMEISYELQNEIDDLNNEIHELEENINWTYNHLDDLLDKVEEISLSELVENIKEYMNTLRAD